MESIFLTKKSIIFLVRWKFVRNWTIYVCILPTIFIHNCSIFSLLKILNIFLYLAALLLYYMRYLILCVHLNDSNNWLRNSTSSSTQTVFVLPTLRFEGVNLLGESLDFVPLTWCNSLNISKLSKFPSDYFLPNLKNEGTTNMIWKSF